VQGLELCLLVYIALAAPVAASGALAEFIYTETPRYDLLAAAQGGERFPNGAVLHLWARGKDRPLVNGFAATADACVSFDGRRVLFAGKQSAGLPWQIWETSIAGGTPRRVTNTNDDSIRPFYLPQDKIVYARRTGGLFRVEILTLDGKTASQLTWGPGNHITNDVLRDGRVLFEASHSGSAGRDLWTVYTDGTGVETHRCDHRGDRSNGHELSSGDIVFETAGGKLSRFTSARASEIELTALPGVVTGPVAESMEGELLLSCRRGLYRWKPGSSPVAVLDGKANMLLQPVVVAPRPAPKWHPSAIGDRPGTNLLCLNVYTSKQQRIAAASIARVRVWTGETKLGEAPVEKDGSFYVQVPGETPLRFELLNSAGMVIAAEKGSWWARRGEQRVCVGCHAGPERAPENRRPQILVRSTEPAKLFGRAK
jgi:hypothetical protein